MPQITLEDGTEAYVPIRSQNGTYIAEFAHPIIDVEFKDIEKNESLKSIIRVTKPDEEL